MSNNDEFMEKRLDALNEPAGFEPNAAKARVQLKVRQMPSRRRWLWTAIPVAAVAMVLPASRAVANMQQPPVAFEHIHYMLMAHWDALVGMVSGTQSAPNFKLTDADGNTVKLSSFRGKVVLLNFWATWCQPCKG